MKDFNSDEINYEIFLFEHMELLWYGQINFLSGDNYVS